MIRNVFACLVHEAPDCVADLVANLRCLDPLSTVLLYDGSAPGSLLAGYQPPDDHVALHPCPRPQRWGALHGFALDCLRHAVATLNADAVTMVDSDQLLLRPGYSQRLAAFLAAHPGAGCLTSAPGPQPRGTIISPCRSAWAEIETWRPYLRRFPGGEALFPQWTFWPSTVFTRAGARRVLALWADPQLQELMAATRIVATEEVVLPTLAALAGTPPVTSPFSQDCVQFRRQYRIRDLEAAARRPDAFWVHPVPRGHDDPLRAWIRDQNGSYAAGARAPDPAAAERGRAWPLVSCIMITRDARPFVPLAVECFLRQDHPDRELVVVDDGADPVADLMPDHPCVRYLRLGRQRPIGMRRNIACAQARGDVIVHWDDAGWSAPWRLRYQVAPLLRDAVEVAGQRTLLFADPLGVRSWRYEYPAGRRRWLADSTLCYRRRLWERVPHHEDGPASSAGYALAGRDPQAAVLGDPSFHVAMIRPAGPRAGATGGTWWRPHPLDGIVAMIGSDWPRYEHAVSATAARRPG